MLFKLDEKIINGLIETGVEKAQEKFEEEIQKSPDFDKDGIKDAVEIKDKLIHVFKTAGPDVMAGANMLGLMQGLGLLKQGFEMVMVSIDAPKLIAAVKTHGESLKEIAKLAPPVLEHFTKRFGAPGSPATKVVKK